MSATQSEKHARTGLFIGIIGVLIWLLAVLFSAPDKDDPEHVMEQLNNMTPPVTVVSRSKRSGGHYSHVVRDGNGNFHTIESKLFPEYFRGDVLIPKP